MTVKSFPDIPVLLQCSKLEDLLSSYVKDNTILGYCIREALLQKKKNYMGKIVVAAFGAYQDNKEAALNVIGEEAMQLVLSIHSKFKQ